MLKSRIKLTQNNEIISKTGLDYGVFETLKIRITIFSIFLFYSIKPAFASHEGHFDIFDTYLPTIAIWGIIIMVVILLYKLVRRQSSRYK